MGYAERQRRRNELDLERFNDLMDQLHQILKDEHGAFAVMVCRHYIDYRTTRDQVKAQQGQGVVGAQAVPPPSLVRQ